MKVIAEMISLKLSEEYFKNDLDIYACKKVDLNRFKII
jgi:hypothetical protein